MMYLITYKGLNVSFLGILIVLTFFIISGCSYYKFKPTLNLITGQSNAPPAVFEIYCGWHGILYSLMDKKNGQIIFDIIPEYGVEIDGVIRQLPGKDYPLKLEIKPGQYTITYGAQFRSTTPPVYERNTVELKSGHYYKFASYFVLYKEGWVWIEDLTSSKLVGGSVPPIGVKEEWRNYHGFCRSAVLGYL